MTMTDQLSEHDRLELLARDAVIAAWVADHASRVADSKRDKSSWALHLQLLTPPPHAKRPPHY